MSRKLRLRGPWLSGAARYSGQDCPVTVDLREIRAVVYRPRDASLFLESDANHYDLADIAPETAQAVTDWIVRRGTT